MPPRETAFGRLVRHFHEHPRGKLHEFLFWTGIAIVIGATTFVAWRAGKMSTPFALLGGLVAICFFGWAFLPHPAPKRQVGSLPGSSKRGAIAKQVKASKEAVARKKKGPGPPIQ